MTAEPDPLEDLLRSVSDGAPVDWDAAVRAAGPGERPRVEALRDVSRIGAFSRGLQRGAGRGGAPSRWGADGGPGERWGELLLLERVGTGARGEVYRAWDPRLQREVALKLVRPEARGATAGAGESPLLAEGRALARIRHPHVIGVHGIEAHDGRVGLRMELVRGDTLEQAVRGGGPLDPAEAARLGIEIGSALAAVHAAGLLHRDVKPANVVRDAGGRFVLADFDLGVRLDDADTRTAWPAGTPMSMAPELLAGDPPSVRSDVYALGMLVWFALAGRHPFAARSLGELRAVAAAGPSPRLRDVRPAAPAGLVAIVERAIAPAPEARLPGAQPFADALREWQQRATPASAGPSSTGAARRLRLAAGVLALLAVAGLAAWRLSITPGAARAGARGAYAVDASFLRRGGGATVRLANGDRVGPGDRLSLAVRTTRRAWVYVLNEDDHGERYLLFPQSLFDTHNPLPADSTVVLPGPIGGRENAWTVTSRGGREHFLTVVSPEPVPELEADLARVPAPAPDRAVAYAAVSPPAVERLRGAGGLSEVSPGQAATGAPWSAFDRFRALAGRETGVRGVWVREFVLENPR